jgi:putative nucleotidyltransferase-like protein
MDTLSRLTIRAHYENEREALPGDLEHRKRDLRYVGSLSDAQLKDFRALAETNHVIVRALTALQRAAAALGENRITDWCEHCLTDERARIARCIGRLHSICHVLESRGCKIAVIKSLDHWPDLGSDLDLYTTADHHHVETAMREELGARPVNRSWGDRLANKWNYKVPALPELVEIHVQRLGQTGEHLDIAKRVIERRVRKVVEGHDLYVPAPEERVVISALQRLYRHFYFRLCDMIDMTLLIQRETVDFGELRKAANLAGIWPGVVTFLAMIQSYIKSYGGELVLPSEVIASARSAEPVRLGNGFLRVSKLTAAGLYGSQLMQGGRQRNVRAMLRLSLLPPLAISALVAHGLTGNDKGIW